MLGMGDFEVQQEPKRCSNDLPLIVMTWHGDVPLAVLAMKAGTADFTEKPFSDELDCAAIIAYRMSISPRTVAIHRSRVMEKMQARSLSELVRMSLEAGILTQSGAKESPQAAGSAG
jgi:two-component system, LuxR family, response regulator FixJ